MMNKQLTVLVLFLVFMFSLSNAFWVTPFKIPLVKASVSSSWYYSNMGYRVEHNITGSPTGNQTNYQMKITIVNGTGTSNESVHYTTHVNQSDFDDVRFTWYNATSGWDEEIDYWREEVNPGSNATFWVEIPEVSNVTDNTIYIYYGNNNTATTSNVNATFIRVIDGNQPVVLALPMDEGSGNKTYDQSGNDNDGTLYPTSVEVNNCDNTTDWSGTSLSSETNEKVEGSASVKDTITSSTAGTDCDTSYNPSGSWDWSPKKHIVFWLKCDRASTAFTNARLVLIDTSNRERHWSISFGADEWTRIEKKLDTFNGEDEGLDLSAVDKVIIRFRAADTTHFYKLVDHIQVGDRPYWIDGKFEKALEFDGNNDYVDCGNPDSLALRNAFTTMAWIKSDKVSYRGGVIHAAYQMSLSWSKLRIELKSGGAVDKFDSLKTDLQIGVWYHFVVTWDGSEVKMYIDRVDYTPPANDYDKTLDRESLWIGRGFHYFDGAIDEVHIFNRALTEEEISYLYDYYGYATTNYAGRVLVRKRVDPEPCHGPWGSEVRYVPVHDIAVVSVAPFSTGVVKGNSINILVEVQNEGTESETFNVTAYYDSDIIDTQTNISLKPRANKILTFTWNTTDVFPGNYTISAQASIVPGETDTVDNIFTDGTAKVILGYPMAYFTYLPTNPFVNETIVFNATLSTPNGGIIINYTWDFGDGFQGEGIIVYHNYSKTGTYNVTLTVTDSEEVNNTAWVTITVSMHDIFIVSVTPSTNEIFEGQTMNITVVVQNNGNFTETFNATIYANTTIIQTQTVPDLPPAAQTTLMFIWNTAGASPGSYTIKAEASVVPGEMDTEDNIFTDGTVKVLIDYPVAYSTYLPINPIVGETVTFNASESTPNGGTIVNYAWDFGDGESGSGAIVTHTYNRFGTYNVTLTITDGEGLNNTAWLTIAVFIHDVTIVSVTPSTNEIFEGQTMNITVVVQNNGNLTETFNVTIYANATIIQTQRVSDLPPAAQTTLTFIWNTTGVSPGNYIIKAEASVIPEETYIAQTIIVHTPPSWYDPLVTWLISVPPLIWMCIGILIIIVVLFRLRIIEVENGRPLEPAEELRRQINRLLQPLAEKGKRFIFLQQFLHQLLEKNPPPETIEFLQNTLPIIIKAITEPKKRKRMRAIPVGREDSSDQSDQDG